MLGDKAEVVVRELVLRVDGENLVVIGDRRGQVAGDLGLEAGIEDVGGGCTRRR